jgi:hypothetical protein
LHPWLLVGVLQSMHAAFVESQMSGLQQSLVFRQLARFVPQPAAASLPSGAPFASCAAESRDASVEAPSAFPASCPASCAGAAASTVHVSAEHSSEPSPCERAFRRAAREGRELAGRSSRCVRSLPADHPAS